MSIEIKDPETERLVRELARRLNVDPAEAVRRASAQALGEEADGEDAAIDAIVAEAKRLPVSDPRPIKDLRAEDEPR